jgi:hypothetical protein
MIRSNSLIEAAKLAAKSLGGLEFFKNLTSSQSLFDSSIDDDDDNDNNNNYKVNHFDDTGMSNLHIAIDILLGENHKGDQKINLNQSSTSSPNKREKNDDRFKKRRLLFAKTYWEAVRTRRKASRTQNKDETYDSNSQTEALFKLILSTSPSTLKQGNKKEKNKNLPDTKTLGETLRFLGITECIQIDENDIRIDNRYSNRTNGYIHDPFKTILESVVRRLVEDKVRAAVLKKDFDVEEDKGKMEEEEEEEEEEHRRILPRTLRWCEQVLMPWLALLLLGDNGLENAVLIKKKSEGRRERRKEEEKGVYNSSSYSHHFQRMNRISRVPHSQFSLTSSIAPELDDGSGGLTGVKDAVVCDENDMDADIDSGFIDLLFGNNTLKEDDTNTNNTDIDSIYRGLVLMRSCDRISFVHAHECIARARSEEAFNLLRDWPSSKPALVDLREAITVAGAKSRGRLVSSIVHSFKTRLLHAGVATASVLDVCLAAVRSLRVVDVSGVMLALIVDPLQAFLRSRPDTIRCIVSSLTEDSGSELYKELETGTGRSGGEGGGGGGNVRRRAWEDSGAGGADESDEEGCDAEDVPDVDDVETNENFLLSKEDEEEEEEEEEDIGMNNEATMTHKKYSKNKAKKRLLYLRSIFRPSVQQRLPTNPFTRGEAMFRSSSTYTVFSDAKDAAAARVLLSRPRGLWYPAPSTVDATREGILRGTHNSGDLLTLLVNIYGSRELFVAEYARVLSQKLLVKPYNDFILDQEERTVELLKVRFGEAAMIKCEAMMKDIVESKRISHAIRGSFIRDNETIVMTESTTTTTTTSGASNSESSTMTSSNAAATIAVELFPSSSISSISSSLGIPSDVEMKSKNKDILPRTSAIESETDCIIVSGRFWPSWQSPKTSTVTTSVTGGGGGGGGGVQQPLPAITNQPENASLASILRKVFDRYATRFADVRKPRELILSPNFGEVTAEIEYPINSLDKAERKIMSVSGTPQQISVLLILAEDGENGGIYISLSVLASKLRLTLNATMRLISYWTNSNVLSLYQHKKKGTLVYITSCLPQAQQSIETGIRSQTQTENVLITTIGESNQSSLVSPNQETRRDDDDGDGRSSSPIGASFEQLINEQSEGDDLSGSTSNSAANEEAELVWTSYITGMLTNLGKLPLDRIHNTLGLFASMGDHPYRKTQQETSRFLSELVRAGKIDVNEGLYSIR